ncbi:hypothetical protein TorRG33x02_217480, partial [Trema orientale]
MSHIVRFLVFSTLPKQFCIRGPNTYKNVCIFIQTFQQTDRRQKEMKKKGHVLWGLHESKLKWARLKLGPTESADVNGEVQSFGVEPSCFRHVLMKLHYPP